MRRPRKEEKKGTTEIVILQSNINNVSKYVSMYKEKRDILDISAYDNRNQYKASSRKSVPVKSFSESICLFVLFFIVCSLVNPKHLE